MIMRTHIFARNLNRRRKPLSVDGLFDHDRLSIGSAFRVYGTLHPAAKLQILITSIGNVKHSLLFVERVSK